MRWTLVGKESRTESLNGNSRERINIEVKSMNELKIQLKELESKQNIALMEYVHFKE